MTRLEAVLQDLRYGARNLAKNRGHTCISVLTLALGIGANTAMFSVIHAVLLRPLPFPEPDRLVVIEHRALDGTREGGSITAGNFNDWRVRSASFDSMAMFTGRSAVIAGLGETRRVTGALNLGSIFEVLGVHPILGRTLDASDDDNDERVIVLGYRFWQSAFAGRNDALGRSVSLDGTAYTVVGVLPSTFAFEEDVEFWVPSGWRAGQRENRTNFAYEAIGRLKQDVDVEQAVQELRVLQARMREEHPAANRNVDVSLSLLQDRRVAASSSRLLLLLMGAVGLVLLIAGVNLANLQLARATGRRHEIGVRQALGATCGRLLRQLLTESLLLSVLGGCTGLVGAYAGLEILVASLPDDTPLLGLVAIDSQVLGFTLAVATFAGICFGIVPALRLSGGTPVALIGSSSGRGSRRTGGMWTGLVVAEVALAVVLPIGAGLLLRSLLNLLAVDPGFRTDQIVAFRASLPQGVGADERNGFWPELLREIKAIPGVTAATAASQLPAATTTVSGWLNFADRPVDNSDRSFLVPYRIVSPGYFETLKIPLFEGRAVRESDSPDAPVAVVNEAARERFWSGRSPIGDRIVLGGGDGVGWYPPLTVVGVVGNVRNSGLDSEQLPTIYLPRVVAGGQRSMWLAMRVQGDLGGAITAARARVEQLQSGAFMDGISTIIEMYRDQAASTRSITALLITFAGVGLCLAAVGVYGVLSYSVSRRSREMGIRLALGASTARIQSMVVGQALAKVLTGTSLGALAALLLGRWLSSLLFEVSPSDPATLAGVVLLLVLVGVVASYLPARRAARVHPVEALRAE